MLVYVLDCASATMSSSESSGEAGGGSATGGSRGGARLRFDLIDLCVGGHEFFREVDPHRVRLKV